MVSHRHSGIVKGYGGIFVVVVVFALSFLVLLAMHLIGLIIISIFGAARELTRRCVGSFGLFFFLLSSFPSLSFFFSLEPSRFFSYFLFI
jgi:hypothetical protein